jgi:hypothetical protein
MIAKPPEVTPEIRDAHRVAVRFRRQGCPVPGPIAAQELAYYRAMSWRRYHATKVARLPTVPAPVPVLAPAPLPVRPAGDAGGEWARYAAPVIMADDDPWHGMFCAPRGWDRALALETADSLALVTAPERVRSDVLARLGVSRDALDVALARAAARGRAA